MSNDNQISGKPFNETKTLNKLKDKSNKNEMTLLFEKALKQSKDKSK